MMNGKQQPIPQLVPDTASGTASAMEGATSNEGSIKTESGQPKRASSWNKFALVGGVVALALVVGIGGYFGIGSTSDKPTQTQMVEMQNSWKAARETGVSLPVVKQEEMKEAIETTNLPERDKAALREEVESGRVSMVWITVWDNMAEDGDIVSLTSDGLTVTVPLYKKPQRIAIPRPAGGVVNLTGVRDGGGGITLGLMSGVDTVLIPPLVVGQKVGIPVR